MEQTIVEDILSTIKRKKWLWARHIMRRRDNRWMDRVTKWQPSNGKKKRGQTEN